MKKMMLGAGEEVQQDCGMWREKRWNLKGVAVGEIGGGWRDGKTLSILIGVVLTAFEGSC
jgi:hypothetical protein